MSNPERFMWIGERLQLLLERTNASLLSSIYLLVRPYLDEGPHKDFSVFYMEMLIGLDPAAREAGAKPRSHDELVQKIGQLGLEESLEKICLALAELMKPPAIVVG